MMNKAQQLLTILESNPLQLAVKQIKAEIKQVGKPSAKDLEREIEDAAANFDVYQKDLWAEINKDRKLSKLSEGIDLSDVNIKFNPKLRPEAQYFSTNNTIEFGPKFNKLGREQQIDILIHELCHATNIEMEALKDGEFWELMQKREMFGPIGDDGTLIRGINGQFKPNENVVEGYKVLIAEPKWLKRTYPIAYTYIKKLAGKLRLPIDKKYFTNILDSMFK
jgi:hypothetical protein